MELEQSTQSRGRNLQNIFIVKKFGLRRIPLQIKVNYVLQKLTMFYFIQTHTPSFKKEYILQINNNETGMRLLC